MKTELIAPGHHVILHTETSIWTRAYRSTRSTLNFCINPKTLLGGKMISNYRRSPVAAVTRGLVCSFGNAENRCFGGASAVRLVKDLGQ
jgi:hypothetical protein